MYLSEQPTFEDLFYINPFPLPNPLSNLALISGASNPRLRQRAKEVVKANDGTPDLQDKLLKGKGSLDVGGENGW